MTTSPTTGEKGANRLGDLLVGAGKISAEQLQQALESQRDEGGRLGTHLVRLGFMSDPQLVEFLADRYGVPAVDLTDLEIDEAVIQLVPAEVARKYTVLPVAKTGAKLTIAMADPTNVFAMDDIKFMTGYTVEPVVASDTALREAIDEYHGSTHAIELRKVMEDIAEADDADLEVLDEDEDIDLQELTQQSEEAPVVGW